LPPLMQLTGWLLVLNFFYLATTTFYRKSGRNWPVTLPLSPQAEKLLAGFLVLLSGMRLLLCLRCTVSLSAVSSPFLFKEKNFLQSLAIYFWELFPVIVVAVFLASWIEKLVTRKSLWLPRNTFQAALWATILPVCSCAAIPMAFSLRKSLPARAVFTFLLIAPVLNPFVLIFSYTVLGWKYTFFRILTAWILGFCSGIILEKLTVFPPEKIKDEKANSFYSFRESGSLLLSTWQNLGQVHFPLLSGIFLAGLVVRYLPVPFLEVVFSQKVAGLFLTTVASIPLFLCSGQEIPLLKPFLQFGLPLGHAISFTLTGNGICLTSIPLLVSYFGRKTTFWIILLFFSGSFFLGWLINLLETLSLSL